MQDNNQAPQGSEEWLQDRLGKVTASKFADVLTLPRSKADKEAGRPSKTAQTYLMDIVAAIVTGLPQGPRENEAMRWGSEHEADAAAVYEAVTDTTCTEVGFIVHSEFPNVGCSPDRLVGDDGGIEIKCPFATRVHLEYRLAGVVPKDHVAQVQGALWVTGRDWWDFVSYDPRIPDLKLSLFRVRVAPDAEYIERLERAIVSFRDELAATLEKLTGKTK